ncbi:hypothetical protein RSOL_423190 [Rhizoctonia solani AG-3 Rhs1AP]|uniref:Uncharacterized protein n=2 Tax=Rhizoctonia solani AG-3 TaxID=1086053 RepID=A0A074S8P9_9AGAM|nr:hypothetical protein RSOL_423190 [Rhizoctonia solani AG-3 Rhs1AP]KEP55614.1 hypothetical protein V565_002280 [Rhizoctonia solani 123E]
MPRVTPGIRPSRFPITQFSQLDTARSSRQPASSLNPEVRSLYRIFLRATSASVLHHSNATSCLRTRYRPVFEHYVGLYQSQATKADVIREWDERIDNTLSLLQNSAVSRGLPHKVTRSLSQLVHSRFMEQKHVLHPKYDPNRSATKPPSLSPATMLSDELHRMLEETTRLAEGTTGLVLGSTPAKF